MKTITKFLTLVLSLFCVFGLVSPVYAENEEISVSVKKDGKELYGEPSTSYVLEVGKTYDIEITDPSFAGEKIDYQTAVEADGFFKWYGGGADADTYVFGITPLKTGETTIEVYPGMYKHICIVEDSMTVVENVEKEFLSLTKDFTVASKDEDATAELNALLKQAVENVGVPFDCEGADPYGYYSVEKGSLGQGLNNGYYFFVQFGLCGMDADLDITVDPTKNAASNTETSDVTASSTVDASSVVKNAMNNNLFTDEQVAAINEGANTEVKTVIGKIEPTAEDKGLVEAQLNSTNKIAMYLDLKVVASVTKDGNKVGDDVTVSETGTPVKFTIALDDSFINTKNTVDRTYQVVRIHNGVVDVLPATFDADSKTITFETDKFSTYALMYTDTPKASKTPSTADNMNVALYSGVAVVSVLAIGFLFFFKKRNA